MIADRGTKIAAPNGSAEASSRQIAARGRLAPFMHRQPRSNQHNALQHFFHKNAALAKIAKNVKITPYSAQAIPT
jgi:hypothetical protein